MEREFGKSVQVQPATTSQENDSRVPVINTSILWEQRTEVVATEQALEGGRKAQSHSAEVSPGLRDSRADTTCCLVGGNQPITPIGQKWKGRKTSGKLAFLHLLLSIQQHPWAHSVS